MLCKLQLPDHLPDFDVLQIIIRHLIQRSSRTGGASDRGAGNGSDHSREVAGDAGFLELFRHQRRSQRTGCGTGSTTHSAG